MIPFGQVRATGNWLCLMNPFTERKISPLSLLVTVNHLASTNEPVLVEADYRKRKRANNARALRAQSGSSGFFRGGQQIPSRQARASCSDRSLVLSDLADEWGSLCCSAMSASLPVVRHRRTPRLHISSRLYISICLSCILTNIFPMTGPLHEKQLRPRPSEEA